MTNQEAISYLCNLRVAIGRIEHQALWHYEQPLAEIVDMLSEEPKYAHIEIIHCRDCEYGEIDQDGWWYCINVGCQIGESDGSGFCADAERRR